VGCSDCFTPYFCVAYPGADLEATLTTRLSTRSREPVQQSLPDMWRQQVIKHVFIKRYAIRSIERRGWLEKGHGRVIRRAVEVLTLFDLVGALPFAFGNSTVPVCHETRRARSNAVPCHEAHRIRSESYPGLGGRRDIETFTSASGKIDL
jgi:hypothetical protein